MAPSEPARDAARGDRLLALDEALWQLAQTLEQQTIMRDSAAAIARACGFDLVFLAEADPRGHLVVRSVYGARTRVLEDVVVPKGWGLGGKAFAHGSLQMVEHYLASRAITHHFDWHISTEGIHRMVAAPIVGRCGILGVVWGAHRDEGSFGTLATEGLERAGRSTGAAIEAASRARQLAQTAVHADRHELALRLHDSVGAMLFAIQAGVRDLAQSLSADSELHARARSIERQALDAAAALRASLQALDQPPERLELTVALEADCRAFEDRTGIPAPLIVLTELPAVTGARADALVDAVREGLLNVEKHAAARTVAVTIAAEDGRVTATVTDDGVGFTDEPLDDQRRRAGIGLRAIAERLGRLGGGMRIERPDGGGTSLVLWIDV